MLAFFSLASAALVVLVSATPSRRFFSPVADISGRDVPCDAGSFYDASTEDCALCPPGNTCNGNQEPQPCDYGRYQPDSGQTACLQTPQGFYQPQRGQTDYLACAVGTYQPYVGQAFCYNAPNGRFQGHEGQAGVCGACCGWTTSSTNAADVYQCTDPTPFSGPASGSGCVATDQGCTPAATCEQTYDGTTWVCPDQTFY